MSAVIVGCLLAAAGIPLSIWVNFGVGQSALAAGLVVMSFGAGWMLAGRRK